MVRLLNMLGNKLSEQIEPAGKTVYEDLEGNKKVRNTYVINQPMAAEMLFFCPQITGRLLVDPVHWIDSQCGKHKVGFER